MRGAERKAGSRNARDGAARRADVGEVRVPSMSAADEEQIRMRAYELYRERGGKVGDDMADWLRAEREYLEQATRAATDRTGQRTAMPRPSASHA